MRRRPQPRFACVDDVTISRDEKYAYIQFKDGKDSVNFGIGSKIAKMTDEDVLVLYNECVASQLLSAAEWRPTEIAEGRPQIKYDRKYRTWSAEGHVLRCLIGSDEQTDEIIIGIDDHDLSLAEFGKMLQSFQGWGMRIEFMSDDQLCDPPEPEVRKAPKRISKNVLEELARQAAESEFS